MPTLQTTPWIDWTFPDQAYARNKVGYVWGPSQEMPPLGEEMGAANPFDAHDKAVALERVKNNHRKMLGQIGVLDTTARSQRQRRPASQSGSHFNGRIETAQSQTAGGLRGGGYDLTGGTQYFFYSKEGQDYLNNLRRRRITELGAIESGSFEGGPPKHIPVAPQLDEVDAVLEKVLDEFESGAFPTSLIDDLNKLRTAFVRVGSTITHRQLAGYVQVIARLKVQVDRITGVGGGPFQMDPQQKRTLRASGLVLDRLERLLLEINTHVNESQEIRQRAVAEISSRILGSTAREQAPYGNAEVGRLRRREPPRQNETQPDVSTRGEVENRQRRIPLPLPNAEEVTPSGEPPVRPF